MPILIAISGYYSYHSVNKNFIQLYKNEIQSINNTYVNMVYYPNNNNFIIYK